MGEEELVPLLHRQAAPIPAQLPLPFQNKAHLESGVFHRLLLSGGQAQLVHVKAAGLPPGDEPSPAALPGGSCAVTFQHLHPGQAIKGKAVHQSIHPGCAVHALLGQHGPVRADILRAQRHIHRLLDLGHQTVAAQSVDGSSRDEIHLPRLQLHTVQALQHTGAVLLFDEGAEMVRRDAGPEAQPDTGARLAVQNIPRLVLPPGQAEVFPRLFPVRMGLDEQPVPGMKQLEQEAQLGAPARGVLLPQPERGILGQAVAQEAARPRQAGEPRGGTRAQGRGDQRGHPHLGAGLLPLSPAQEVVDHLAARDKIVYQVGFQPDHSLRFLAHIRSLLVGSFREHTTMPRLRCQRSAGKNSLRIWPDRLIIEDTRPGLCRPDLREVGKCSGI